MKKILGIIITLLFFASVTVFTLPMMQDDGNADFTLSDIAIMAQADELDPGPMAPCWWQFKKRWIYNPLWIMDCDTCERIKVTETYDPMEYCETGGLS